VCGNQVFEQWGSVIDYAPPRSLKYSLFVEPKSFDGDNLAAARAQALATPKPHDNSGR
jgi:hypothetical protein